MPTTDSTRDAQSIAPERAALANFPENLTRIRAEVAKYDLGATEIDQLRRSIAYESCCSLLESECLSRDTGGVRWLELPDVEGEFDLFDAVRYLDAEGLIERHPQHGNLVQILDEGAAAQAAEDGAGAAPPRSGVADGIASLIADLEGLRGAVRDYDDAVKLVTMERALAYRHARGAIARCCTEHDPCDGGGVWYSLTRRFDGNAAQADLTEELEYLTQRGLLVRHAESGALVRVLDLEDAETCAAVDDATGFAGEPADSVGDRLLREARGLLDDLRDSREFMLYIDPDSTYGKRVREWLTRYAEARLGRGFGAVSDATGYAESLPAYPPQSEFRRLRRSDEPVIEADENATGEVLAALRAEGALRRFGEPWSYEESAAQCVVKRADGVAVADTFICSVMDQRPVARRIVACVNACRDFTTDVLEALPEGLVKAEMVFMRGAGTGAAPVGILPVEEMER